MAAKDKDKDTRKLEKTMTPGIYRRHAAGCKRDGRCHCSYVVVWKAGTKQHKQMFPTLELAREHKGRLDGKTAPRKPQSAKTLAAYYEDWLPAYRGRTSRGLEESTRRGYESSFRLHILPLIGHVKLRDLDAGTIRDELLHKMEARGVSPATVRRAKIALTVMLACAVEDRDLASNPAAGVRYVPSESAKRRHAKPKAKQLTGADVEAILAAMPGQWRAFFTLLAHTGMRVGELLGLTWGNVHLGDDPHVMVAEQVYRGERKKLKSDHSRRRIPLSAGMAAWLGELRPEGVAVEVPVFPSRTGEPLNYANVYNRVLRPALVRADIAVQVGERKVRRRGGSEESVPVWDYQGVAFHRFRHACGSLLLAKGDKNLRQVSEWLGHAKPSFTHDVYIDLVDDGLGGADVLDELLPVRGNPRGNLGATEPPETAANSVPADTPETVS